MPLVAGRVSSPDSYHFLEHCITSVGPPVFVHVRTLKLPSN